RREPEVRGHAPGPPVRRAGSDQVVGANYRGDLGAVRDVPHDPRPHAAHADLVPPVAYADRDRTRPPPEEERIERRIDGGHRPAAQIVVPAVEGPPWPLDPH